MFKLNSFVVLNQQQGENFAVLVAIVLFATFIFSVFHLYRSVFSKEQRAYKRGEFPDYKFNKKSLSKAYIYLGLMMIKNERDDVVKQLPYLYHFLIRKFGNDLDIYKEDLYLFLKENIKINSLLDWIKKKTNKEQHIQFLDFICNLAFYNTQLTRSELQLLKYFAEYLNIDAESYESIVGIRIKQNQNHKKEKARSKKNRFSNVLSEKQKAFKVLGLENKATPDEIKKRYRSLAKKFHPDRFVRMGEDELRMANERFAAINHAYDVLTG